MQKFVLALKNEKVKFYQRLGWFIILILTLLYAWFGFFTNLPIPTGRTMAFLSALVIAFLLRLYFLKSKYQFGLSVFFIILVFGWIAREQYFFAGITLIFQILNEIASRKKVATFSETQIIYPSFPVKKIDWKNLNNCLLKDSLLTIDFKTNKIIQQLTDEKANPVDENEFNEFCRQQLQTAGISV